MGPLLPNCSRKPRRERGTERGIERDADLMGPRGRSDGECE